MRLIHWDTPRKVQWSVEDGNLFVCVDGMPTWGADASGVLSCGIHSWRAPGAVEVDAIQIMLESQMRAGGASATTMRAKDACWLTFEDGTNGALVLADDGLSLAVMAFGASDTRTRSLACTLKCESGETQGKAVGSSGRWPDAAAGRAWNGEEETDGAMPEPSKRLTH